MNRTARLVLLISSLLFAEIALLSQTSQTPKPSFDVVSIKPSAPTPSGIRGGGTRGNRYTMTSATLRMLLQQAYQQLPPAGTTILQLQIVGGPNWMDSDRYDIQATVDCSGGVLSREQVQLMVQSMLEDRFQLKSHMETRELPIYSLVVARDGAKIKASEDQITPTRPAGPPQPCGPVPTAVSPPPPPPPPPRPPASGERGSLDPNFTMPKGSAMIRVSPAGLFMQAAGVPLTTLVSMVQQQVGRPVIDKTDLKGLFDFKLQFSPEGLALQLPPAGLPPAPGPGPAGSGPTPPVAADPIPSLFTAIQELGLRLESTKGPVPVLVVDSVQKPKEN